MTIHSQVFSVSKKLLLPIIVSMLLVASCATGVNNPGQNEKQESLDPDSFQYRTLQRLEHHLETGEGRGGDYHNVGVGLMYGTSGYPQDHKKAMRFLRHSVEKGNTASLSSIGTMYENGWGVRRDMEEAFRWYSCSAEAGQVLGYLNVGNAYYNGQVVNQNYDTAAFWWRKAAERGQAEAMINFALIYARGVGGYSQDFVRAHAWASQAARRGTEGAETLRNEVASKMTRAQIASAQSLSQELAESISYQVFNPDPDEFKAIRCEK